MSDEESKDPIKDVFSSMSESFYMLWLQNTCTALTLEYVIQVLNKHKIKIDEKEMNKVIDDKMQAIQDKVTLQNTPINGAVN